MIILHRSQKVWDRAGIELVTPGSAVRLVSVARHVTDCEMCLMLDHFLSGKSSHYCDISFIYISEMLVLQESLIILWRTLCSMMTGKYILKTSRAF